MRPHSRGACRQPLQMAAFIAAACLLLVGQPAHCARRHVQRRVTLEEMEQISELSDFRCGDCPVAAMAHHQWPDTMIRRSHQETACACTI